MSKPPVIYPTREDPLGYDGDAVERVRAMAKDAIAGKDRDAVLAEAERLRRDLGLAPAEPLPSSDG